MKDDGNKKILATFPKGKKQSIYLAGIPVKKSLPFKFKVARVLTVTTYVHHPMMVTINFSKDKIMDASCNLKSAIEDIFL